MFLIRASILVKNVTRDKIIYNLEFDPSLLAIDEIKYLLTALKNIRNNIIIKQNSIKLLDENVRDELKSILSIVRKAIIGDKGNVLPLLFADPVYYATLYFIADGFGPIDIPIWWCAGGQTGKLFTNITLCTRPSITATCEKHIDLALNPWSLSELGDLDTIIDDAGDHKTGTIAKDITRFLRWNFGEYIEYRGEFIAGSNTTVRSVFVLRATSCWGDPLGAVYNECTDLTPAPRGTCDPHYYAAILVPIWGFDTDFSVIKNEKYCVMVRFYR